eukprot:1153203-Pelagomonas_calceolata.AAC.7
MGFSLRNGWLIYLRVLLSLAAVRHACALTYESRSPLITLNWQVMLLTEEQRLTPYTQIDARQNFSYESLDVCTCLFDNCKDGVGGRI